jgi:phosphoribosylformylglycinamidine synthase
MFLAKVHVMLKPTVNDPQGLTIKGGLESLGFKGVKSVRAGKLLEIRLDERDRKKAEKQVDDMCKKLLSNPVVETYRFELQEVR